MALPSVVVLQQLARARLRRAAWSVAGALLLLLAGLTAVGLAVTAGVIVTAERIGVVEALLAWSSGLALLMLVVALGRLLARRRRRLRELERASSAPVGDPAATLLSDIGFRAGMSASTALPPLAAVAAAFVIGTLVARGRR